MTPPSFYDPRIMLGEACITGLFSLEQMIRWALSGNGASAGSRRRLFKNAHAGRLLASRPRSGMRAQGDNPGRQDDSLSEKSQGALVARERLCTTEQTSSGSGAGAVARQGPPDHLFQRE